MLPGANGGRSPQRNLLVSPALQGYYASLGLQGFTPSAAGVNPGVAAAPAAAPAGGFDASVSGGYGTPTGGGLGAPGGYGADPAPSQQLLPPMGGGEPYGLGPLGGLPQGAWPGMSPWPVQAWPFLGGASPLGLPFGPLAGSLPGGLPSGLPGGLPGMAPFGSYGAAPSGQPSCG